VAAYGYEYSSTPQRWSFPNLPFLPTFGVRIGYWLLPTRAAG